MEIKDINELLAAMGGQPQKEHNVKVATRDEAMRLMNDIPKAGDVVRWRKGLRNCDLPAEDEDCIVTSVFANPLVRDAGNSMEMVSIMLAFSHHCGDPECKLEGGVYEHPYDGRRFEVVGSVLN